MTGEGGCYMKRILIGVLVALLAACAAQHPVRCDAHLTPINAVAKSSPADEKPKAQPGDSP